jgi:methanogenic corrinoid protein MtbC1
MILEIARGRSTLPGQPTTMPSIQATIEALKAASLRDRVKVIVGAEPSR